MLVTLLHHYLAINFFRASTIIGTSSTEYQEEFAERSRPSSWRCPVMHRHDWYFRSAACAFRHERRVVGRSFLREEKRSDRISPTQKRQFFWRRTNFLSLRGCSFFLPLFLTTQERESSDRAMNQNQSLVLDIVRRKKKKKRSETAWKMRSRIFTGIIRDTTRSHLEQFAFGQCVSRDLNA